MVGFGVQHVKSGWLSFTVRKTKHFRSERVEKPILPQLQEILDATPCGNLAFLTTEYGKPFTAAGFGGWFKKQCERAGLAHCTAHGLRKAGATRLAEAGATDEQLRAVFDWTSPQQSLAYTRKANKRKLTEEAMKMLDRTRTDPVSHLPPSVPPPAKSLKVKG